jgi:hypothetical protein
MMSVQHTPRLVALDSGDVTAISRPCEELAVALYMSDMPDRCPKGDTWTLVQLAAWVLNGIATLEGDQETWRTAYRSRRSSETGDWTEYHMLWDDPHREKTARRMAAQITESPEYTYKPVTACIAVWVAPDIEWHIQVDVRDVQFAAALEVVLR